MANGGQAAVIPRYQKVLFAVLVLASLVMGGVVWRQLERAHERLLAGQDSAPTKAPEVAPAEPATMIVANDADGSLRQQLLSLPLPADPGARGRAVLGRLLDLYAAAGSAHPVQGGASAVKEVFLMPAPAAGSRGADEVSGADAARSGDADTTPKGPQLAIVNLAGTFAGSHPSGIEVETLTVLSISGTLHANIPQVTEVRFLIDGEQHTTLAGHADLTRTYLAGEAAPSEGTKP
jgi:hypothetical protein